MPAVDASTSSVPVTRSSSASTNRSTRREASTSRAASPDRSRRGPRARRPPPGPTSPSRSTPEDEVVEGHVDDAPGGRGRHQQGDDHRQDAGQAPVEHVDDGVDEHGDHPGGHRPRQRLVRRRRTAAGRRIASTTATTASTAELAGDADHPAGRLGCDGGHGRTVPALRAVEGGPGRSPHRAAARSPAVTYRTADGRTRPTKPAASPGDRSRATAPAPAPAGPAADTGTGARGPGHPLIVDIDTWSFVAAGRGRAGGGRGCSRSPRRRRRPHRHRRRRARGRGAVAGGQRGPAAVATRSRGMRGRARRRRADAGVRRHRHCWSRRPPSASCRTSATSCRRPCATSTRGRSSGPASRTPTPPGGSRSGSTTPRPTSTTPRWPTWASGCSAACSARCRAGHGAGGDGRRRDRGAAVPRPRAARAGGAQADRLGSIVYAHVRQLLRRARCSSPCWPASSSCAPACCWASRWRRWPGLWTTLTNLIPQIGGFLGGGFFVLLALTQGPVQAVIALAVFMAYQNLENNVISPAIVGQAVNLSPPTTMLAALVGAAAAGVPGALGGHAAARGGQGHLPRPPGRDARARDRAGPPAPDPRPAPPPAPAPATPSGDEAGAGREPPADGRPPPRDRGRQTGRSPVAVRVVPWSL